jgi:hypothetical protein
MRIEINSSVLWRNPATRLDSGRLGEHQACASHGAASQMDEMPWLRMPVYRGVLAHRRDDNAIFQLDVS